MYNQQDPWSWVEQQKPVAPLTNAIAPLSASQEQPPGIQVIQDPMQQQLQSMAMGKALESTASGINAGIKAYGASTAPLAVTPAASTVGTAAAEGLAASGIPGVLPAAASTVPSTLATGAGAATAGTSATTAGLGTAATAGGEAALTAMGPVGWAIGAGLLAKKLGIF